ncbi:MAG: exodeoxyribonuclease VII large subunit [Prochlorococcaceae cyanobacterium]
MPDLERQATPATPASNGLPRYSVLELNRAIGSLLERGFAPRFLVEATVSRPQLKKGHLWMTLVDGEASIQAVVWASQLERIQLQPQEGDGVTVVGKLNFWAARASLTVQVLDLRPSLSAVLRQFETVRQLLLPEGMFDPERKRPLPIRPGRIALLTSAPSSALADMLRTAADRWPATRILVVPIPVQGPVEAAICQAIHTIGAQAGPLGIEALVLARGGGSREDLAVFDGEALARCLASCPIPVVTGLGHEDDTTIADLVADLRAATPTAAIVALLPERRDTLRQLQQEQQHLQQLVRLRLQLERQQLEHRQQRLLALQPSQLLQSHRQGLEQRRQLLAALSPAAILGRGFCLLRNGAGQIVHGIADVAIGESIEVQLTDGRIAAEVTASEPYTASEPASGSGQPSG